MSTHAVHDTGAALPRLISVDDHVLEPADLWWDRLPSDLRERGPRARRERGLIVESLQGRWTPTEDGPWADVWHFGDMVRPLQRGLAQSGFEDDSNIRPVTFEEMLPATYDRAERLIAMDLNHTDVSLCYPSISRFCGQMFLSEPDRDLSLRCLQVYNDWMIDEWCGHERPARLVPLTVIPLWDAIGAAAEVRRCAAKGAHAISFPECPPAIGLPSIFSTYWDPLFTACEETDTVLNLHVGSAATMTTAPDAPLDEAICFFFVNSQLAFTDWLYSGVLETFSSLRLVLAEGQVGWMPFVLQRIDNTWKKAVGRNVSTGRRARSLPSESYPGHIFGSIFDDLAGLQFRDAVGIGQILVETDFPHQDSAYPHSGKVIADLVSTAGLTPAETHQVVRSNAIKVFGLDRYFGIDN